MDVQTLAVVGIVALAVVYVGKKTWDMVKPGAKAGGCGCSGAAKSGCGGCPLVKS